MRSAFLEERHSDVNSIDERVAWRAIRVNQRAQDDGGQRTFRKARCALAGAVHVHTETENSCHAGHSGEPDHFATSLTAPSKNRR